MVVDAARTTPGRLRPDGRIWFVQMIRSIALVEVAVQHLIIGFWLHNDLAAQVGRTRPLPAGVAACPS